jgi:lysozyme family protein
VDDLEKSLDYLLEEEGGWSNHPSDKGGATMYGVTQATYNAWRRKKKRSQQSVRSITQAESKELYKEEYWNAAYCDKLPWPINYMTFDAAVNSGVSRAVRWTQGGLGLKPDGVIGNQSILRAEEVLRNGEARALVAIVDKRVEFLARLVQKSPSQADFLLGWWRRTQRVLGRALIS